MNPACECSRNTCISMKEAKQGVEKVERETALNKENALKVK